MLVSGGAMSPLARPGPARRAPVPFADQSPARSTSPGQGWRVVARTDLEVAVCTAPGGGAFPARLISPEAVGRSTRGSGSNVRHVRDILPDSRPWAHSLLVVEVVTPAGNWSSYPSHKHDLDDLPRSRCSRRPITIA